MKKLPTTLLFLGLALGAGNAVAADTMSKESMSKEAMGKAEMSVEAMGKTDSNPAVSGEAMPMQGADKSEMGKPMEMDSMKDTKMGDDSMAK